MGAPYDDIAREILDIVPIIMRMIRTEMRSQHSADLAIPQFRALLFISRNPGLSLLTLAHHLSLTSPTVSKMVDGLVLNHLVKRESSSKDRRKITITLTPQGQTVLDKAQNGAQARLAEILAPLTLEEGETVYQAMELLQSLFLPYSIR
jgi:DNA-binding MarR family transcriptional regulator